MKVNSQPDNKDDRLSIFEDESSTITTRESEVKAARENIHSYERAFTSELHEGKTTIIKLGKARKKQVTHASLNVNFTIMKDEDHETYLGGTIGNCVTAYQRQWQPGKHNNNVKISKQIASPNQSLEFGWK